MRVQERAVLLTGGTGALGQVVAEAMLREGAQVATSYRSDTELKSLPESFTRRLQTVRADVTSEAEVAELFSAVRKKLGRIDILIHLVGGYLPGRPLQAVEAGDWDRMMNLNLRSAFLCAREFLREERTFGRIIAVAALTALRPAAGRAPYAVSKAGIVTLVQTLGEELKGTGVTANAIAPSILDTRANRESMPDADPGAWVPPEHVAETMLHLCSQEGGTINGVTIPMVGGVS